MIVSFYTPGYYAQVARERLLPSVRALGLPHDVREINLAGSWEKRTRYKADYLQQMRAEHPGADLLWLDADAVVHSDPLPLLRAVYSNCNLAVHYLYDRELLSGTLWIPGGNWRTGELLRTWQAINDTSPPEAWDQHNLAAAIEQMNRGVVSLRITALPPEFCCIFDTSRSLHPHINPIIEHFQASREYRRRQEVPA